MKRYLTLIFLLTINFAIAQQYERSSVPAGLQNTTRLTAADAAILNSIEEVELPTHYSGKALPDSLDNSIHSWLRPIFTQDGMSCMQSTSIAYNFTYEINRLRGIPSDISDNQYPTHFAWNFFNGGNGWFGANYLFTMDVLKYHGTPNITDYGGFHYGGGERWMSGYDEWYNAMNNRLSGIRKIYVGDAEGLLTLKHWLNDHLDGSATGGLASFIACSPWDYVNLPSGTPNAGKYVMTAWCPEALHGMTIVGYNDLIRYDYNNDGQYTNDVDLNGDGILDMRDWEIGALKFVNSYGEYWANSGYCFMMYKTLADDIEHGGIWANTVHVLDVKEQHDTRLTYKISLEHGCRKMIRVRTGISSDPESNIPEYIQPYTIMNFQGSCHYMQGNDTTPDHKTIEFGLDVTPLLLHIEPGEACKFFLIVDENDPQDYSDGQVKDFSIMDYASGVVEIPCDQQNVPLINNGTTILSIIYDPDFDDVEIITEDLPVYEPDQAIEVQLAASGGQLPYTWHLDKNYRMNLNTAEFPMIEEDLLIENSYVDSLAVQALDFSFPFYGNNFDTVIVSSSGYLYFDENFFFWSYIVDMAYFLKNSRVIAPFMSTEMIVSDQYDHGVWYEGDANSATFRWKTGYNVQLEESDFNFAVKLFPNGNIEFFYGDMETVEINKWITGIADGDFVNYSLPELPEPSSIQSGTHVELISGYLPDSVTLSREGELTVFETSVAVNTDIKVIVTDNTLLQAEKTFQLTDGLEYNIQIQGIDGNTITNGEVTYMSLLVKNRGAETLHDIEFTLSCYHGMVTITDFQQLIESLQPNESIEISRAFICRTNDFISDGHYIVFDLEASALQKTYQRAFYMNISATDIGMCEFSVQNATGILEPGETADLQIKLINKGSIKSTNARAKLIPDDPGITVNSSQPINFGTILPGHTATAEFNITSDYSFTYGSGTGFTLEVVDEIGMTKELHFSIRIGKVPVCIVDMDPAGNSGLQIYELLQQMEVESEYTQFFPLSFNPYQSVILCLGKMFSNHDLTYQQGVLLEQYLSDGGKLYMEGSLVWQQAPAPAVLNKFNFGTVSSPGLYEILDGVDSTFTQDLSYENSNTQPYCAYYLEPQLPAFSIFTGREYPNCAAVAYDAGSYKTIGTIFELGVLMSSDTCQLESFMQGVLDFFEIKQSIIGIEEAPENIGDRALQNFPNPFSHQTSIPLRLDKRSFVDASVFDLQGRRIFDFITATTLEAGNYNFTWDGNGNDGRLLPDGIFIYRILIDGIPYTGKMVLIR
ncbi:MAG: hypothetical protein KAH26_06710 [Bacteroidales bacterium]|nr:hypothetical protein [Bacteroidales bacterium]